MRKLHTVAKVAAFGALREKPLENPYATPKDAYLLAGRTRDISGDVLDPATGRLRILPAAYWATTTKQERALFGNNYGIASFPTEELVEYLRNVINGRNAIEIGAGHGVLAEALGIPATDSRQHDKPAIRRHYQGLRQATSPYGPNIVELAAHRAVRRYKPDVVIACWVTHKYERFRPHAGGNTDGVDEEDILANCAEYVFVGNTEVHQQKKIWPPPKIEYPSFVYSRAMNGTREFIGTWTGSKA